LSSPNENVALAYLLVIRAQALICAKENTSSTSSFAPLKMMLLLCLQIIHIIATHMHCHILLR